jgi:iron complex outermembrane recepter protein
MKNKRLCLLVTLLLAEVCVAEVISDQETMKLEEIIVTARKRDEPINNVPMSMSAITRSQLEMRGISSLGDFISGAATSSINVLPYSGSSSLLTFAIRGNGPGDAGQSTRDANVALYMDGVYLARSQALDFEFELDRIEILRGPQGTLFGRNATSGAINLISKRPTGIGGVRAGFSKGSYDEFGHKLHIDFPAIAGIATKIENFYTSRDGWVKNAPDEPNFNSYERKTFRFSSIASPRDDLDIAYSYTKGDSEDTHIYYQVHDDVGGVFGNEGGRQKNTRFKIAPLYPTTSTQRLHTLNMDWQLSETLSVTSLSAYRELKNNQRTNFGGAAYYNGWMDFVDVNQSQISQEIRLSFDTSRVDSVLGFYGFSEKTEEDIITQFSLDIYGISTGVPLSLITPTDIDLYTGQLVPQKSLSTELESLAIFGHTSWTPPVLYDKLELSVGARLTNETKSGERNSNNGGTFELNTNGEFDPSFTIRYGISDAVSTYFRWATAHRTGGVNSRADSSTDVTTFDSEKTTTAELGFKLNSADGTFSLTAAGFSTKCADMFIDIINPQNPEEGDTINAENPVTIKGIEVEFSIIPVDRLKIGASYTYLDGDMPDQPNRLNNGAIEPFLLTQTPRHSGVITLDYELPKLTWGQLSSHLDIIATDSYHHYPSGGVAHPDSYTLVNAKILISEIPFVGTGDLNVSLSAKNLTDKEYIVGSFNLDQAATISAYGDPRTVSLDINYDF